jgi:hypothetical protein
VDWWEHSYKRDTRKRWRYAIDGSIVPGSRDLLLKHLWKPARINHEWVSFPTEIVTAWPEFAWARQWSADREAHSYARANQAIISTDEWELQRDRLVGLVAPELCVSMMLRPADLAAMLGCKVNTVHAYVNRGFLPPPTINRGQQPLWSVAVLTRTLIAIRKKRRAAVDVKAASLPKTLTPRTSLSIDDLDAALAALGISDEDDEDF